MELETHKGIAIWEFATLEEWRTWLEAESQAYPKGIWARIAKKSADASTISYEELREGALCYGWIDSLANKLDSTYYLLKVTPRRPGSVWSKINVALCEEYIADNRMRLAGLKEIEAAKADGRWDLAYGTGEIPKKPRKMSKNSEE